jgi:uncharacterized protein
VRTIDVDTAHGRARAHLDHVDQPAAALILGHGAGGGVASPDLRTAAAVTRSHGLSIALVEQPYRVAGRRSPAPARQLDAAWTTVLDRLRGDVLRGLPLLVGGRSSGGRVACRTAQATGAVAVLCLAFPLQPPRRPASAPAASRIAELENLTVPTLVVQGDRDPFGIPPAGATRRVVRVASDHSLKTDLPAVAAAIQGWLAQVLPLVLATTNRP